MAMVIKAELSAAKAVASVLEKDIEDTNNLMSSLLNFYGEAELRGRDYDMARKKISLYLEILNSRKQIASLLYEGISNSTAQFINFMEEYDVLDDAELEDVRRSFLNAQSVYSKLSTSIKSNDIDEKTKIKNISNMQTYYKKMMNALELIDKLEQLSSVDGGLYGNLANTIESADTYNTKTDFIQVANISI